MFSANFGVTSKKPMFLFCNRCALLVAGVFLLAHGQAQGGTTIRAASVALVDVKTAVASASSGDTVIIPAGTASWTSGLTITKGITLQGSTTISGDHTTFNSGTPMTANDQTIILDNIPKTGGLTPIFYFTHSTGTARVTGVTVKAGSVTGNGDGGVFLPSGSVVPPANIRIDHCHLDQVHNTCLETIAGQVYGVMDHCLLDMDASHEGFVFTMANWGGHSYGDGAWAAPTDFGGPTFFFIEDCTVNNALGSGQVVGCTDSYGGGKFVVRYSKFINCVVTDHGTASVGNLRSVRAKEIYNNTFLFNRFAGSGGLQRGGCALIHDNTYTYVSPGWTTGITLQDYRTFDSSNVWGGASGNSIWDLNSDTSNHTGNGIGGGANGLIASGTVLSSVNGSSSAPNTPGTMTVSGTPWMAHQFQLPNPPNGNGYTLTKVGGRNTWIIDNTSNTITFFYLFSDSNEPLGNFTINAGNSYQIYKLPTAAIDQCGRGQGDLLSGDSPAKINAVTGTASWPRNALEPVYSWNNTLNGSNVNIGSSTPTIIEGRDFYNQTPMPGYTPYTYPHPLVSGVWQANLRVVSGP